eukprot:194178-Rhodomonas_salina.1
MCGHGGGGEAVGSSVARRWRCWWRRRSWRGWRRPGTVCVAELSPHPAQPMQCDRSRSGRT